MAIFFLLNSDFPIATAVQSQHYPTVQFANNQFYVFWQDLRFYPSDRSTLAARVTQDGIVLDPEGIVIMRDKTDRVDAAYDGTNFLVVVQDSC